jgi:flagellar basal body-associated protein FliL
LDDEIAMNPMKESLLIVLICVAIFNTAGILPILYILYFQKNEQSTAAIKN